MKLRAIFILLMMIFGTFSARAQSPMVQELPLSGIERIELQIPEGNVQLTGAASSKSLRFIRPPEVNEALQLEKKGSVLVISMKSEKTGLFSLGSARKMNFELVGVPIKVHVLLGEGQIAIQKWTQDISVTAQKAKVSIQSSTASSYQVSLHRGDLQVADSTGVMSVDSYSANISVKQHQGDLKIENFSGETLVEKSKGNFAFEQASSQLKVMASSGSMSFELLKGQATLQSFAGRVEGQSTEGAISAVYAPETELNLKTKSGRVSIQIPSGQGPYLSLTAGEGDILVPGPLKVAREATQKTVRARFRGENAKGSISVRAEEGSIQVR